MTTNIIFFSKIKMSNCGFDFAKKYSVSLSDALAELKEGTTLRVIEFKAQYVLQQQNRINEMLTKSIHQEKSKLKAIHAAQKKLESAEEGYKVWTVKQLQIELKSRGLKQTGNKEDYVERLTYHDLNGRPPAVTITKTKATKTTKVTKTNESFFKPCASTSVLPSPFTIHDFPEYTHIDPELDDETMRSLMAAVFQIISSTTITDADVEDLKDDTRTSRMLCKLVTRMRQMQWNREDEAEGVEEIDDYIYKIREVHHGRPIFNSLNQNSDVSFARLIDQRGYEESLAIALKLNMDLNTIRRFIADTISGNYRCGVDQQQVGQEEDDDDNVSFNLYCTSDDDSEEEAEAEEAEAEEAEAEEAEAEEAEAEEAEAEEAEAEEAEAEEAEAEEAEAEAAEAEANDPTIDYECTSNEWSREGDDDVNLDVANVFTNKLNYEDGTEKTDTVLEEAEENEEKEQHIEVDNYMYTSSDSEEEEVVVENVDLEVHTTKRKRSDKKTKSNKRAAKLKKSILKEVMQMMMPMMMPYGAMPMMMPYGAMPMMQQQQAPMMMPMMQQQQAPMMMPMMQQQQQAPMMMPMVQQYAPMMQMMQQQQQQQQQQGRMN